METIVIMSARHDWSRGALADITNGRLGDELGTHALTISQNARMLRLLVKAPNLVEPITAAAELVRHGADAFNGIHGLGPSTDAGQATAYTHLNNVRSAFDNVETAAIAALRGIQRRPPLAPAHPFGGGDARSMRSSALSSVDLVTGKKIWRVVVLTGEENDRGRGI